MDGALPGILRRRWRPDVSKIEIDASLKTVRVTAEGAIAVVLGLAVAAVIIACAVRFLTDWL